MKAPLRQRAASCGVGKDFWNMGMPAGDWLSFHVSLDDNLTSLGRLRVEVQMCKTRSEQATRSGIDKHNKKLLLPASSLRPGTH